MTGCFTRYSVRFSALFACILLAILGSGLSAYGQSSIDECSGGIYYLIAFPDTTTNTWDNRFPAQLIRSNIKALTFYIYSPVDQMLEIGRMKGENARVSITAGEIIEYNTEQIAGAISTRLNTPELSSLYLKADYPVILYAYILTPFGAEAFTPIPVESWGTEYYAAQWPGQPVRDVYPNGEYNFRSVPKEAPGEIMIIAAHDSTRVKIDPTAKLKDCAQCETVTLMAGETYQVQSVVDTAAAAVQQGDLAGTFIQANKPIGVISGNTRLMLNTGQTPALAENSFKNLAVEWMPPVEQHGTEFVFLPTWDDRRQREGLDLEESRAAELVRIFGTGLNEEQGGVSAWWLNNLGEEVPTVRDSLMPGEFTHEKIGIPVARYYKTTGPAFAISSPESVVKFNGTTTYGANYVGASYLSWGTYMVELIPRRQWTSFAPVRVPSLPTSMVHYLNLTTDTNNQFNVYYRQGNSPQQLFPFNRGKVPGSDLVWGSIPLNKGVDYIIEGDKGARFTGVVYGSYRGQEQYRPGGTKEGGDEKGGGVAGGGDDGAPGVLHPSEYEEDVALMYAFPLAPSRCALVPPDEYEIETQQDCDALNITVRTTSASAAGIRSVTLLPDSSRNVRLEFVEPTSLFALKTENLTAMKLRLVAIDPQQDAHGVLIIKDRTRESERWRVAYNWEAERIDLDPDALDFGEVPVNQSAAERMITITNPLPTGNVVVKRLSFLLGTQGFAVNRTEPAFDWAGNVDSVILKPGQTLRVWVSITPTEEKVYQDSLRIHLGCVVVTVPTRAATARPCLSVDDLDFGTLSLNEQRTLPLEICNTGNGSVTFGDPWLTWLKDLPQQQGFGVDPAEIAKLQGLTLEKDECVTLQITFTASAANSGLFRTTARLHASTRNCRDTSIWKVNVLKPGPQIEGYDWRERWLSGNSCTKNPIPDYRATIMARNAGDIPFDVVDLEIVGDPERVFSIGSTAVVPDLTMDPGDERSIEVIFDPKEERVYYTTPATVRLTYKIRVDGKDSIGYVEGILEGVGIESYAAITDQTFGTVEIVEGNPAQVPGTVVITASGLRPVNIDQIVVDSEGDFRLAPSWLAANPWALSGDMDPLQPGTFLTMDPGTELKVDVEFIPQGEGGADKRGRISVVGDFAYDHCSPSDSSGDLSASVFALGATAEGVNFGSLLTCYEEKGFIIVRNTSPRSVQITKVSPIIPSSMAVYFSLDLGGDIRLPYTLAPKGDLDGKDILRIPVRFTPNSVADYSAVVEITVMNIAGTKEITMLTVPLQGNARIISAGMSVRRDHHGASGTKVKIPITLDVDPASAEISDFILDIDYDEDVLSLEDVRLGDLFPEQDGWVLEGVDESPGGLTVRIYNTANKFIVGTGDVLVMEFVPLAGRKKETEIPFNVTPVLFGENLNRCVEISTSPGYFTTDLLKISERVSLIGITPNPLKDKAVIRFGVREPSHVQIGVYTSDGRRVALLLDQDRGVGVHSIEWDATDLIKGAYYVQIKSGDKSASWGVRILK